jgi:chloride channel protein, CIC family
MVMAFTLKLKLAPDMIPPRRLALLCLISLAIAAAVSLCVGLFVLLYSAPLRWLLPGGPENFEGLSPWLRVLVLLLGLGLLMLLYRLAGTAVMQLSVAHVIDRVHHHQGHLPLRNAGVQFVGALVSLVSGQSVGQEGPLIHLGAATGAGLSLRPALSLAERQLLIGCGVAAALGACFNTPLGGVVLALELVLIRASWQGVLPLMIAAGVGASAHQWLGSPALVLQAPKVAWLQLPWMAFGALCLGVAAGLYILVLRLALRCRHRPLFMRFAGVALLSIGAAIWLPEVMGLGLDTLQLALDGQLLLPTLLLVGLVKLLLSPCVVGLGVPGGLIGPTLLAGACLGGALGLGAQSLWGVEAVNLPLYALLGMASLLAASLNAPMAALVAVLEISQSPVIIAPALLMIALACLSQQLLFRQQGLFLEQLRATGRPLPVAPPSQAD